MLHAARRILRDDRHFGLRFRERYGLRAPPHHGGGYRGRSRIDLSVWGSADGVDWGARPLAAFPQKFYCGTYQILLDLEGRDIKYVRATWTVNRWGKGDSKPLFGIYLFAQPTPALAAMTA